MIRLRLRGEGTVRMSLNRAATTTMAMTDSLQDIILTVPARTVDSGTHVLSLAVDGGGRATLDRLRLVRDP